MLSFCQSLLPDRIGESTDDELESALMRVTESALAMPAETCLGILARSVARDIGLLKGAFSSGVAANLLNRLRLFQSIPEELVFDYAKPMLVPLMQVLPFKTLRHKWTTWVFEQVFVPLIEETHADSQTQTLKNFCTEALTTLELPSDADPGEHIVELIAESMGVFQAVLLLLTPTITNDTELTVIDDLKALSDAAEDTRGDSIASMVGMAIKGKLSLARTMSDFLKWQAEGKAHGASIQRHLKELKNDNPLPKLMSSIPEAIDTYEKYTVNLPSNATACLQEAIASATKRAATMIISDEKPEYADVQLMSNLLVSCSRVAPLDAMIKTMQCQVGEKLRQYNDDSKKTNMAEKAKLALDTGFKDEAILNAIAAIDSGRKVPPSDFGAPEISKFSSIFQAGVDNLAAFLVESFGGASHDKHLNLLQMLEKLAKYTDNGANRDLIVKAHSAFMGMSAGLAAVTEKYTKGGAEGEQHQNELEMHMRSLSRALAKARSAAKMCEGSNIELPLPKENYDECEATFNKIAAELLDKLKSKGTSILEEVQKLKTSMAVDGAHNWIAKAAEQFGELAEMAKSTILKSKKVAELSGKLKIMCTMKENFKSSASALQQSDASWPGLDEEVKTTTLLLAEHRMMLTFMDPSSTKGSRRGVAKSSQDELVTRGFTIEALPPALRAAMRLAIGMKPIA